MTFLIILDGADEGDASLLKAARTPCLDMIIKNGVSGKAAFFTEGMNVDSLSCISTILGLAPCEIPDSRAPLEAAGFGIDVDKDDLVWRCNVVSVKNGILTSFNGGGLSKPEMCEFALTAAKHSPPDISFFHLSDYRNIIVVKGDHTAHGSFHGITPPHQGVGMPYEKMLERIAHSGGLTQFIMESSRIKNGYMLYPWAPGKKAALPQAKKNAACVCKAEIMAGIAKSMGMALCIPKHATADYDTDLKEKARAALTLSKQHETVIIHVNGTDELAHKRNFNGKVRFFEKIDSDIIGELLSGVSSGARFIITSDHVTSSVTGCHESLPVNWHCADFHKAGGYFCRPSIDGSLTGKEMFYNLLKEEIN